MKKILGIGFAAFALAAVVAIPKASAANGVKLASNSTKTMTVTRKISRASGKVATFFNYNLTPKDDNPAPVLGATFDFVLTAINMADDNHQVIGEYEHSFSDMTFSKVGNYTFTLSEVISGNPANYPLASEKYDIYFEVRNVLDDNGEPTGELSARMLDLVYSYKDDAKVALSDVVFESDAQYSYITLENKVNGDAAETDKYFKYRVSFRGLDENDTLTIVGQDETIEYNGETVAATNEYHASDGDLFVYLKHGQTVTIGRNEEGNETYFELPQNVAYTIEKLDEDNYETNIDGVSELSTDKMVVAMNADDFSTSNQTSVVNSKDMTVNTGAFVNASVYLFLSVIGVTGFIVFRRLSHSA